MRGTMKCPLVVISLFILQTMKLCVEHLAAVENYTYQFKTIEHAT